MVLKDVSDTDLDDVVLKTIDIQTNVMCIEQMLGLKSYPIELVRQSASIYTTQADEIEAIAIGWEIVMVEEMGHAFYFEDAMGTREGKKKLHNEIVAYKAIERGATKEFSSQRAKRAYTCSPIEIDGNMWKNAFKEKIYPAWETPIWRLGKATA